MNAQVNPDGLRRAQSFCRKGLCRRLLCEPLVRLRRWSPRAARPALRAPRGADPPPPVYPQQLWRRPSFLGALEPQNNGDIVATSRSP